MTVAYAEYSLYFATGREMPQNLPLRLGIRNSPTPLHSPSWPQSSPYPKRHLDWFCRLSTEARTDTHTALRQERGDGRKASTS